MAEPKTHLMHYRDGERMALCGRMAYGSWFEKPERWGGLPSSEVFIYRIHLPGRHEPEMSLEAASFGGAPRVGLTDAGSHTGCLHRGRCRGRSRAACRLSTGGVHRRRNGPARTAEPRRAARSGMSRTLLN